MASLKKQNSALYNYKISGNNKNNIDFLPFFNVVKIKREKKEILKNSLIKKYF
jgi:hypothetical protein